ncbi:MAG TPA: hypothetical protein VF507_02680 [Pyrinomonadaceae bacterium]
MQKRFRSQRVVTRRDRARERGAALITVLLTSTLLLTMGGALILSTSMSMTNAVDTTSEARAYYAAEAGLQASLNVLRGNVQPNPLPTPIPVGGAIPDADKISFRGAVTRSVSNLSTDPATLSGGAAFPFRLSQWLQYNYTPSGSAYADRIVLSPDAANYSPLNGTAYGVEVSEVEDTQTITYSTSAVFTGGSSSYTFGSAGTTGTITYTPQPVTTVSASSPIAADLGSFTMSKTGSGATIPKNSQINLRIDVYAPWRGTIVMGGTVSGSVDNGGTNVKITFSSNSARVVGTLFTLGSNPVIMNSNKGTPSFTLASTVTAPEPRKLRVRSTGYGPKGARKVLEMIVSRFKYEVQPSAPIVRRGSDDGTLMTFDLGTSGAKRYSGKDVSNIQPKLPVIAIKTQDWTVANVGIGKGATIDSPRFAILDIDTIPSPWPLTLVPAPSYTPSPPTTQAYPQYASTPDFLVTADAARQFLNDMQEYAQARGRYFSTLTGYADSNNDAANVANPAFTFVDGDCTLYGGAGMLIVTGNLVFEGNNDFQGIILVLGRGRVTRSGTGNGQVLGGWMVASFSRTGTTGFTAPYFDVSGGGSGKFYYDTKSIDAANKTAGSVVVSEVEK